jgi:hypothetical protein
LLQTTCHFERAALATSESNLLLNLLSEGHGFSRAIESAAERRTSSAAGLSAARSDVLLIQEAIPKRLKPRRFGQLYGAAEAVPFQKTATGAFALPRPTDDEPVHKMGHPKIATTKARATRRFLHSPAFGLLGRNDKAPGLAVRPAQPSLPPSAPFAIYLHLPQVPHISTSHWMEPSC